MGNEIFYLPKKIINYGVIYDFLQLIRFEMCMALYRTQEPSLLAMPVIGYCVYRQELWPKAGVPYTIVINNQVYQYLAHDEISVAYSLDSRTTSLIVTHQEAWELSEKIKVLDVD